MIRKFILMIVVPLLCISAMAQTSDVNYTFTEASELNIIGKIHDDTPNPYHRVDTARYKGWNKIENIQVRCPAGLAVLFKTNSSTISVQTEYGWKSEFVNMTAISYKGYDLYIKRDGEWLYAASGVARPKKEDKNLVLISNLEEGYKECMLYLPIYCEVRSVKIGVEQGSDIQSLDSPFRHRIGIYGSSFTQGICASRAGMSYPMQLMRSTGLQFLSLGCGGNGKMQPHFAEILCDADVDAFVFDVFSNPTSEIIAERLFPFIEKIRSAHPEVPLIFQQTIYRERRSFDQKYMEKEKTKQELAARLMKEARTKYDNVYFIQTNATDALHSTSVDGSHPNDYGYTLWAKSIEKPLLRILKKHGIK